MPTPRLAIRALLLNIVLVTGSMMIALGCVELGLRAFRGEARFYPYYPNSTRLSYPNPEITPGVSGKSRFSTNSFGTRGREPLGAELRILTIGGSTTADSVLDDEESWSSRVEQYLGEHLGGRQRVWVANAAVDGHLSHHHLMQVIYFLPLLADIDYVVVHAGINDLGLWFHNVEFDRNYLDDQSNWDARIGEAFRWSSFSQADAPLYKRLEIWKTLSRVKDIYVSARQSALGGENAIVMDEELRWLEERRQMRQEVGTQLLPLAKLETLPIALESYGEVLERIGREIRNNGAQPIFMTQTVQSVFASEHERSRLWMGAIDGGQSFVREEDYPIYLGRFNDKMREVASRNQILLIDLPVLVGRSADLFYDGMHFSEKGAAAVGAAVADAIVDQL